jgi:hypothetical protein
LDGATSKATTGVGRPPLVASLRRIRNPGRRCARPWADIWLSLWAGKWPPRARRSARPKVPCTANQTIPCGAKLRIAVGLKGGSELKAGVGGAIAGAVRVG